MTSLKDVATIAGVSPSTVSRVINGTMYVTDETRRRVEEAIATVNYRPNLLAQSLRLKATRNIGLLVPEIAHPSFNLVIKYIEESAFKRGLNLLIFNTHNNHGREANAMDLLLRQRINGIIFSRISDENHVINMSRSSDIPMVVIDRSLHDEKIPNVILDNYLAGVMAAEHLLACGCKKMATITGSFKIGLARERFQGFRDTLEKHGLQLDRDLVYEGEFNFENGVAGVTHFLETGYSFDGLWGQNDMIAAGAIGTLVRHGIKVPEDVSVMGMDDVQFARMYCPSISTIAQPYKEMCEKAVECIDKLTKDEEVEQFQVLYPPKLVVRESTAEKS
ncbi:LacI family transcriptional regulator [Sphaerochaeta halotolerans]|uniref:LacI family transcriptional regulator n=1 Tax=Sphaerochaeta halotolerans TaxID=2293840 RepID=A0A372MDA2_9SPIR|nr:LacI family DNA-binding transcriptional regulator [Sphaerochaeta halotolerans]RFU93777.1 LacI family transcriptional regulator [Sphaerochaeta halotolerans]